ncbi:unnamed protein product [Candidula unifasciata]|uniref:Ribosomal protein S21 n=1 Tax=Candidula unifasciata TaxID=100452 RepID=A0A8S3YKS0_9EUPU|nr:unnamed protein product [Candidula unifasciata]
MTANHVRFLAKTVLVRDNKIEPRKERYEKPFLKRNRLAYERCRRIYDAEMQRKIEFVMRKNRPDPFLR